LIPISLIAYPAGWGRIVAVANAARLRRIGREKLSLLPDSGVKLESHHGSTVELERPRWRLSRQTGWNQP